MMRWFAYQPSATGSHPVPVAFADDPNRLSSPLGLVEGSLRQIPPELGEAPLSVLMRWANGEKIGGFER